MTASLAANIHGQSVVIAGIGAYMPERVMTNDELAQFVDTSDEWIRSRSGIRERRIAAAGETSSTMGAEAARRALRDAGLNSSDIDLIIVGTMTPDMPFPATACLVQAELGLTDIPAFDVGAACSGFLYILEVGFRMLRGGSYRNILLIGAEKMSSVLDWSDRSTCVLFGDGAGAVVLSRSDVAEVGVIDNILHANGQCPSLLYMPAGGCACPASADSVAGRGHHLKMNGKEIFKVAVKEMANVALEILHRNQVRPEDIACVIPHQANIRIIESLAKRLQLPMERFLMNIDRFGNTSAASIPLALQEARAQKRFGRGDYILLASFGAGLTWAASIIKWHS